MAGFSLVVNAQTPGFVQDEVMKVSGITSDSQIPGLTLSQKQVSRTFFDGLGRAVQSVAVQGSPMQKDIIQPVAYDALGRQTIGYLPYASSGSSGVYHAAALTEQGAFYNNGNADAITDDTTPYSQQVFENSPLQRLLQAGSVGSGFQPGQHYQSISYTTNTSGDAAIQWGTDGNYIGSYGAGVLQVKDAIDQDGGQTRVFTDLAGHTVLKRQLAATGVYYDTYYIYNSAGQLVYTVPPKALAIMASASSYSLTQTGVVKLIYSYKYDTRGRMIKKTVPGSGDVWLIYDPVNRPVLLQDANLRKNKQWNYIKYDAKGRAISQGIYTDATRTTLAAMQTYVSGLSGYTTAWSESRSGTLANNGYYTNSIFPTTGLTPLAYSYFDDYDLNLDGTADYSYTSQGLSGEATPTTLTRGMPTLTCSRTVGSGLSNIWSTSVIFYDKRGNGIQVKSNNQLNYTNMTTLTDTKTSVPDFTGKVLQTKVTKVTGAGAGNTNTILSTYTYDAAGMRLNFVDQTYNSQAAVRIAGYSYNELGQMIRKGLGGINGSISANLTLGTGDSVPSGTVSRTATNEINFEPDFSVTSGAEFSATITPGFLQWVDYRYSIRGQLTSINNSKLSNDGGLTNYDTGDLFGMQLLYDQADANMGNTASYSGKVTGIKWMTRDGGGTATNERSYKYSYDLLNRLTASVYAERTAASTGSFSVNANGFNESGITYDQAGNILTLQRNSSTIGGSTPVAVDDLNYTYDSANPNRLQKVTDGTGSNYTGFGFRNLTGVSSTSSYSYDIAGNLTADPYKGLALTYNLLNRSDKITITTATNRWLDYTYDASGVLMRKRQYDNNVLQSTTDYIDGFVYVAGALQYAAMPEGRVMNNAGTLYPEYIIGDNQGNARFAFKDSGSGTVSIVQENSFYSFGLAMGNSPVSLPTTPNKNLYNGGSEWQNDFSNLPDYYQTFFRNYDAAIGRWTAVDPDPESAESMGTYQYSGNNPVMFNDPLGDRLYKPIEPGPELYWAKYIRHKIDGNTDPTSVGDGSGPRGGGGGAFVSVPSQFGYDLERQADANASLFDRINGPRTLSAGYAEAYGKLHGENYGWNQTVTVTPGNGVIDEGTGNIIYAHAERTATFGLLSSGANQGVTSGFGKTNDVINTISPFLDMKTMLIEGGVAASRNIRITAVEAADVLRATGSRGIVKYLGITKGLGIAGSVVTTGYSSYQVYGQYQKGGVNEVFSHRDVVDAGVGAIGLGATGLAAFGLISNPVGWTIGAGILVYSVGTLIYDATHKEN
jgi:RHS repeat-associated protein